MAHTLQGRLLWISELFQIKTINYKFQLGAQTLARLLNEKTQSANHAGNTFMSTMPPPILRQHYYQQLLQHRLGDSNDDGLAQMYASWLCGQGALPLYLGLPLDVFRSMMEYHFPSLPQPLRVPPQIRPIDVTRMPELDDLRTLLQQNTSHTTPDAGWMVEIVCAACLSNDHLWQDLGLWSRQDLSKLMHTNFQPLAEKNTKDMKWKKFLYKQLCESEGIYVCRAPSCEVCLDYAACFDTVL